MIRFCAGDWDFGSETLNAEVANLLPGRFVGETRNIDEVWGQRDHEMRLIRIHLYEWDGEAWRQRTPGFCS